MAVGEGTEGTGGNGANTGKEKGNLCNLEVRAREKTPKMHFSNRIGRGMGSALKGTRGNHGELQGTVEEPEGTNPAYLQKAGTSTTTKAGRVRKAQICIFL